MVIDTRAMGFPMTEAILHHVEQRVAAALGWAGRMVTRVTVRLEDVNGPNHHGADKRCQVVASMRRRKPLVVDVRHEDLYAAVDEAAALMRRSATRRVERRTAHEREDRQRPGALLDE